jgi:exosortase H (IPTLxxWG-CTERM-specific)
MSLSNKKKYKKNQRQQSSILTNMKGEWLQKRPVLFFVLGFSVMMILFYFIWLSDFFEHSITPRINGVNARIASVILNIFGQGTHPDGFSIISGKFSISIAMGCDAIEAMALFAIAVIAFPGKIKHKIIGVVSGIFILYLLNQVRIISLFLVGIYYRKAFELMHVEVWQFLFIIFAIALWIIWIKWTRKNIPHVS